VDGDVADDVWACCYYTATADGRGTLNSKIGAFLVRADSHAEAVRKATEFSDLACARLGLSRPFVIVNNVPGEGAVMDIENGAVKVTPAGADRRYYFGREVRS